MRKFLAAAFLIFTAGCGGDDDAVPDDNHGFGFGYDLSTVDGVRLRNLPGTLDLDQAGMEHLVAEPYRDVENCAQIVAGGPLVVVTAMDEQNYPIGRGNTYLDTGLILITAYAVQTSDRYLAGPNGRPSALRHEFVHYLLAMAGFPDDLNASHQSPLFVDCAGF